MIKSHKVRRAAPVEDESESVTPQRRRRKMSLAQLEQRVQRRRASGGIKGVLGVLKNFSTGLQRMNQTLNKQSRRMPAERDINRQIWG